ncbi:C25 family cysteine peptidase [Coprobacter sp.]
MRQIRFLVCCMVLWGMSCLLHAQMLIVCAPEYMDEMKPFVTWKIQKGIPTQMVSMSEIGVSSEDLKTYVKQYYESHHNRYLLLVGDAAQIPVIYSYGITNPNPYTPYSDAEYGYISGDDYPPEILVGRFSAESAEDVRTQVDRVIFYERDIDDTAAWLSETIGIADPSSTEKGDNDETDIVHIRGVNSVLGEYGYTAHEVSAKKRLIDLLNAGCGIVNYVGHGYMSSWSTTGFSVSDMKLLSNKGKLPVIVSAACDNGKFIPGTCLSESFLRARNVDGDPIGAVGMLGFSSMATWNPLMLAQDEIVRILTASDIPGSKKTFGEITGMSYEKVIGRYKGSGEDAAKQWILFGDPSMLLRSKAPEKMIVSHVNAADKGVSSLSVECDTEGAIAAISAGDELLDVRQIENGSATFVFPAINRDEALLVTVTSFDKVAYQGQVIVGNGSGLLISEKETVNIYPNPLRGEARITGINGSSVFASVYSHEGILIKKMEVNPPYSISLNILPGTYFVRLQGDGIDVVRHILIVP